MQIRAGGRLQRFFMLQKLYFNIFVPYVFFVEVEVLSQHRDLCGVNQKLWNQYFGL